MAAYLKILHCGAVDLTNYFSHIFCDNIHIRFEIAYTEISDLSGLDMLFLVK